MRLDKCAVKSCPEYAVRPRHFCYYHAQSKPKMSTRKCAVKGCVRATVNGLMFCVYHPNAKPSVTCDNIPSIKEQSICCGWTIYTGETCKTCGDTMGKIGPLTDKLQTLTMLESQLQSAHCKAKACRLFSLAMCLEGRTKEVSREILITREAIDNEVKCQNAQAPTHTVTFPTAAPASITVTGPYGAQSIVLVFNLTGKTTP